MKLMLTLNANEISQGGGIVLSICVLLSQALPCVYSSTCRHNHSTITISEAQHCAPAYLDRPCSTPCG